jgi:tRNA(Ile)-lysidine synthase
MAAFDPSAFAVELERLLPVGTRGLWVAFSGGLDSTVLLHAAAQAARLNSRWPIHAIHIDHNLHPLSASWTEHCARTANALAVPFESECVTVDLESPDGLEAAARKVRYAALRRRIGPEDALLTAHHADDQLETLLLALGRGAGVTGLSAMPACARFGQGVHARPLLGWTRLELESWARGQALTWISDPSNEDRDRDRNFLRHDVLPTLRERWPHIAVAAVRASSHLGAAQRLLDELAAQDALIASVGCCLDVDRLAALSAERRDNLLRFWIRQQGARAPSTRRLHALGHEMFSARLDSTPHVDLSDGWSVRRHRGLLYCEGALPRLDHECYRWDWREPFNLPKGLGTLQLSEAGSTDRLPPTLEVRFRTGGERLQMAGHAHHSELKKLLQSSAVLPWWRPYLPIVWAGERLLAVGDLWASEEFSTRVQWHARPAIFAVER